MKTSLLLLAALACTPREDAPVRVLLVTFDTTRADRLGAYGHAAAETPVVDALAARGLVYEQAFSPAPITLPAHASLLTGVVPRQHGVRDNALFELGADAVLVSEVLQQRGVATAAFVGSYVLDRRFGLDQGFDRYTGPGAEHVGARPEVAERDASLVVDDAVAWLATLDAEQPFFLWVHFYDPHQPLRPPAHLRARIEDPYDAEIAFCDEQLGRLLASLAERGLDRGLWTIVTADHGESLGEHGEATHGVFLYNATLRVPLVVAPPAGTVAPGRIADPVALGSVAATVLRIFAVPAAELPATAAPPLPLAPGGAAEPALYLESLLPLFSYTWHPLRGVVWQGYKLVQGRAAELYALEDDPAETHDLAGAEPELAAALQRRLQAVEEDLAPLDLAARVEPGAGESALLRSLGYVSASASAEAWPEDLPDPRERIGDLAVLDRALALLQQARQLLGLDLPGAAPPSEDAVREGQVLLQQALAATETLARASPHDSTVQEILGLVHLSRGDFAAAVAPLESAVLARPQVVNARYNLGLAYAGSGREEWAEQEMLKTVSLEPRLAGAWAWLFRYYTGRKDERKAVGCVREWLRHRPADADAERLRGVEERLVRELESRGVDLENALPLPVTDLEPEGVRRRGQDGSPP